MSSSWRRRRGEGRTPRSSLWSPSPCTSPEQERKASLVRTSEEENGDVHADQAGSHPLKTKRMRYMNEEVEQEQQWSGEGTTSGREENKEDSREVVPKKSKNAISPSMNSTEREEEEEAVEVSRFASFFTGELSLFLMMLYPLLWVSPSSPLLGKSKDSHRPSSENELDTGYAVFCLSARCIVRYLTRMSMIPHRHGAREEDERRVSGEGTFSSSSTSSVANEGSYKDSSGRDVRENSDNKKKDKKPSISTSSCGEGQLLPSCPSALLIFLGSCMKKIESSFLFADLTPGSTGDGEGSQRGGSTMEREREEIREMASQLIAQVVGFIHKTQGEQKWMHCLPPTMEAKEDNCRLDTSSFYLVKVLRHYYKYMNVFSSGSTDKNEAARHPSWKYNQDVQKDIQKRIDGHSLLGSSLREGGRQGVYFDDDTDEDEGDSFPSVQRVFLARQDHPLYIGGRTEENKDSENLAGGRIPSNPMKRKEDLPIRVTSHVDARHLVGSLLAIAHLLSTTVFCTPTDRTPPCISLKKKKSEEERCLLNKKTSNQEKEEDKKTSSLCCREEDEEGDRMMERKREDFSVNCERLEREEITLRCVEMVLEHVFFWGARYCCFSHTNLRGHLKEKEEEKKKKNVLLHAFFEKDSKGLSSLKNMKETEVLQWTPELLNASLRALVGICNTQTSQLNVLALALRRKAETDKGKEEKKEEKEMKDRTRLDSTKGDENEKEMIMEEVEKQSENEREEKTKGRGEEEGLWVLVDMLEFVLQQALAIAVDEAGGDLKPLTSKT